MPAVVPAVTAAFSAVQAFAASSALASFLVNTVSSIAMSALATAIQGKPSVKQPGISTSTTTAGGTVAQRLIFGRYCTAGQMVAPMMVYQTDGNPNEWLVYVISLADKPITALRRIFVDGKALDIDGDPAASKHTDAMGATVIDSGDDSLRNKVYVRFHNGRQTAADAYLRRVFGTYPERPWTADMIGVGVAYVVVTFKGKAQDGDYQGFPSVKFEVDGHALLDPRDSAQDPLDETTWKFTRNPAVIAFNILRGIGVYNAGRWGIGTTRFLMPYVLAAANLCDEAVPTSDGGTRPRYQAGLEVSVSDEPHTALTEIVKAMGGDVADMGGIWVVRAGPPAGAVLSITDDDIIVTDSRSLKPFPGLDETYNGISATYPDPSQQWEPKEAAPLYNAAFEKADGGRRLVAEVDFPAVTDARQVRALMGELLADYRRMRTHVITLPPDACGLVLGDHIAWTSAINGYSAKLFKVVAIRLDPVSLCVAVTLKERNPADYDPDKFRDGVLPTVPSVVPVAPVIRGVYGWTVTAVSAGGKPGIRIAWSPEINARGVSWRVRLQADGSLVSQGTLSDVARGEAVLTEGLRPETTYLVSGRLVLSRNTDSTQEVPITTLPLRILKDDLDKEVLDDVDRVTDWMDGTGGYLRELRDLIDSVRDGVAETEWGNFIAHEIVRTEAKVAVANAEARASSELIAATGPDSALAMKIDKVEASVGYSEARTQAAILAATGPDSALAGRIDDVEASIPGAVADGTSALVSRVEDTEAGLASQSDAITAVSARTNRGTANGLLRVSATSAPTGVSSRIGLRAEAANNASSYSAALFLEANTDGTSEVTVIADRFAIVNGAGDVRSVPFIVKGGAVYMNAAFIEDASITSAKIGEAIQSNDFVTGASGRGWRILKSGEAEFNNVTIRRQIEIASGSVNLGDFVPDGVVVGGATASSLAAPGKIHHVLATPVGLTEWQGAKKTYIANCSMTGSVTSNNTDSCYWGWTADVMPLTKWDGNQSLRLRLSFWSQWVTQVQNCVVTWKIYEVS